MGNEIESTEVNTPQYFYTEMISAFYKEARKRGYYAGDDVFAPELMQAGGDFTNNMLLNERLYEEYQGDSAAYYHDVAEAHLYAGAYYTHAWHQDRESIKNHNFAIRYLRSGAKDAAEPFMPISRQELVDFCNSLYVMLSARMDHFLDHPDVDSYIFFGLIAFFMVSVSMTAKSLGLVGTPYSADMQNNGTPNLSIQISLSPSSLQYAGDMETSSSQHEIPAENPEQAHVVKRASVVFYEQNQGDEKGTAERFWLDLLSVFMETAAGAGYYDEDVPYLEELVQPGIEFVFTMMSSKPYYESNKNDMKQYYYKMARHSFCAGAYYAYLWDKQSRAHLDNDFHLQVLRAGLQKTVAPLMPVSYDEISKFCYKLYLQYAKRVAPYASHPDYPVFMANGMHAFYMIGMTAQLKWMRIE